LARSARRHTFLSWNGGQASTCRTGLRPAEKPTWAYSTIFLAKAWAFLVAAVLAMRVGRMAEGRRRLDISKAGDGYAAGLGN